jgi:hypothetical protein
MATIHFTHELIVPDEQGREQLLRCYLSRAGRARAPQAMPGPRAQQVGHRAVALVPRRGRAEPREQRGRVGDQPRARRAGPCRGRAKARKERGKRGDGEDERREGLRKGGWARCGRRGEDAPGTRALRVMAAAGQGERLAHCSR